MKKLLSAAAALSLLLVPTTHAFDVTTYSVDNLLSLADLEAATASGVRCRGVLHDPTDPDKVILFAQEGADVWFLTYDLTDSTLTVLGGDTVNNLKGGPTTVVRGAFAVGDGVIVYHDGEPFGTLSGMDVATGTFLPDIVVDPGNLDFLGSLAFLGGDLWIGGESAGSGSGADMDLLLINSDTGDVTVIDTLNSLQDIAVIGSDRALVADGWNRLLFDVSGIGTTNTVDDITPTGFGFPEPRTIQGMVALSEDFYILHDDSPSGFDDDILAVWDGTDLTDLVFSDILPPGQLYPNFHTGLALVQPDPDTIHLYIANFNNFVNEPALVRIEWSQATSVNEWMMYE